MKENFFNNIAVLVDADNGGHSKIPLIMSKILTFGRITLKRVYGNWKKDNLKKWESVIKDYAFNPQQQFDYVKGKNATDIALVIDAMKLLYTERYDAFVIVASDSDYTPLCISLRETGVHVIGIGDETATDAFRLSCDDFYDVNKLDAIEVDVKKSISENSKSADQEIEMSKEEKELHQWLKIAAETERWQDDEGYVNVSSAGQYIQRLRPDFDIKSHGFKKLPEFIKHHRDMYETKSYRGKGKAIIHAYKCK